MLAPIGSDVVLRPHPFAPHLRGRWRRGLWLVPLMVAGLARQTPLRGLELIAIGLGSGGILLAISRRIRLALVDGVIRRTSWWGRTVTCPAAAVADVVELTAFIAWTAPPETWLLFRADEGRTLMRALVSTYRPEEVERFRHALDRPFTRIPRVLTVQEVRREFPGSFHWPWAHYWLTFLFVLVGGFFAAVLVVAIVDAIG
ncbi:MAG TPA: hypothetical protein VGQ15_08040 [Gaiellaceae bacterium]|jgi:hypothetical protein|nr:hypothetical protein [Gaiellaceae bacterium]